MHDELQQVLVAITMEAAAAEKEVASHPQRVAPMLSRIEQLARTAVTSTRRIVNDLRPLMLEELGLVSALEALTQQFEKRTGIRTRFDARMPVTDLPPIAEAVGICLYRVAQESLNNVAKHSGASEVVIELNEHADGLLTMRVCDNGRGLPEASHRSPLAFGLKGMSERVATLGGSLCVDNAAQGGASIVVEMRRVQEPPQHGDDRSTSALP